jgi:hypothetical protein
MVQTGPNSQLGGFQLGLLMVGNQFCSASVLNNVGKLPNTIQPKMHGIKMIFLFPATFMNMLFIQSKRI